MHRKPIAVSALVLALTAGCGDDSRPRASFDLDDDTLFAGAEATLAEGDEFAALSRNGAVKLGLTAQRVYFELSDAVRQHVDSAIATELESSDSRFMRSIGSAVRRGVAGALEFDIDFRVAEIDDVEYRDGELVFDFVDQEDERALENLDIDGEPITRAFSEEDARAFVAAFRRVKAGAGTGADTAGGASF